MMQFNKSDTLVCREGYFVDEHLKQKEAFLAKLVVCCGSSQRTIECKMDECLNKCSFRKGMQGVFAANGLGKRKHFKMPSTDN